jgi:hypothetical protein
MSNTDLNALKDLLQEAFDKGSEAVVRDSDPWDKEHRNYDKLKSETLSTLYTKLEEIIKPV